VFSSREKDSLLREVIVGNFKDANYTYKTSDRKKYPICVVLNKEGYIRLNRGSDAYYCFATLEGRAFSARGGYCRVMVKKAAKRIGGAAFAIILVLIPIVYSSRESGEKGVMANPNKTDSVFSQNQKIDSLSNTLDSLRPIPDTTIKQTIMTEERKSVPPPTGAPPPKKK